MRITTTNYTVAINGLSGWFEHHRFGDECGGTLSFNYDDSLRDYDGVCSLPLEVAKALREAGRPVSELFTD